MLSRVSFVAKEILGSVTMRPMKARLLPTPFAARARWPRRPQQPSLSAAVVILSSLFARFSKANKVCNMHAYIILSSVRHSVAVSPSSTVVAAQSFLVYPALRRPRIRREGSCMDCHFLHPANQILSCSDLVGQTKVSLSLRAK